MIRWTKFSRRKRAVIAIAAALVAVPVLIVVLANVWVLRAGAPYVKAVSELPRCQVAIVLGAKVQPGGQPSAALEDRLRTGIELYQAGLVQKLLLSGDHGQRTYDEVNAMRRYILAAGIPKEDIFLDHAGFSTYDTMYRARDVFQVKEAILVTQRFHLPRAIWIARQLGLEAWGCVADKRTYASAAHNTVREWFARVKAVFELHIRPRKPRYLGPAIPITGDGRATWDQVE
jgi:SanA protein